MRPDGFLRNAWTVIIGTGGRFPPEHLDTFPGIAIMDGDGDGLIETLSYPDDEAIIPEWVKK